MEQQKEGRRINSESFVAGRCKWFYWMNMEKEFRSVEFANWIERKMHTVKQTVEVFIHHWGTIRLHHKI